MHVYLVAGFTYQSAQTRNLKALDFLKRILVLYNITLMGDRHMDTLENVVRKRIWNHRLNVQIDYNILYSKFKEGEEKKETREKWQWGITLVMFVLPVIPFMRLRFRILSVTVFGDFPAR